MVISLTALPHCQKNKGPQAATILIYIAPHKKSIDFFATQYRRTGFRPLTRWRA
jgi:hypothetical protein